MTTVVLSVPRVADHPRVGGHFWEYMQYAHGLQKLGCDVWWMERLSLAGDPAHGVEEDLNTRIELFLRLIDSFGFRDRVLLYTLPESGVDGGGAWNPLTVPRSKAESVVSVADLFLNFDYRVDARVSAMFAKRALVDIDPGLAQFWMSQGQLRVSTHDIYFTTGQTIGTPDATYPDCGLPWMRIAPAVALDLWPYRSDRESDLFTTVSSWWGDEWITDGTGHYENNKRVSFLEFLEVPRRSGQTIELALFFGPGDAADLASLRANGWRVRHSTAVASTPGDYRRYIQGSKAEFSCAKPSCMRFANGWISDRTLCYMASGKPAVVQDTGPNPLLPREEGLLRFSTIEEAVAAIADVNANYERHCRAARELVEARFAASDVVAGMLEAALARPEASLSAGR